MRVLDCNKYTLALQKSNVAALLKDQSKNPNIDQIRHVAVATHIPIIVVATYYEKLYGQTIQLTTYIIQLCAFYTIDSVIGFSP